MVGGRLDGQGSYYLKSGTRARTLASSLVGQLQNYSCQKSIVNFKLTLTPLVRTRAWELAEPYK